MRTQNVVNKKGVLVSVLALCAAISGPAMAELPTEASDAFAAVGSDAGDMIGLGWPIVVGLVTGLVGIKLFKKITGRVT